MQRIDENTYIDDTLVTCAEYQLFIDEMREQGKYYQPDHWTSYQFPAGQAREPILGMRHSDAVAFCEWLTNRDSNNWIYRLPIQGESNTSIRKPVMIFSIGIWLVKGDSLYWIDHIPADARLIEFGTFIEDTNEKVRALMHHIDKKIDAKQKFIYLDATPASLSTIPDFFSDAIDRAHRNAPSRALNLDIVNRYFSAYAGYIPRVFERGSDRNQKIDLGDAFNLVFSWILNFITGDSGYLDASILSREGKFDILFDLYFDLFTSANALLDAHRPSKEYASSRSGYDNAAH